MSEFVPLSREEIVAVETKWAWEPMLKLTALHLYDTIEKRDAEIAALKADLDKAAAANVNLAQTVVELRDDIAALKAKVERLVEAGDAAANFWPGHTHGMMGKSPGHRCERCERVAAWAAAKEAP